MVKLSLDGIFVLLKRDSCVSPRRRPVATTQTHVTTHAVGGEKDEGEHGVNKLPLIWEMVNENVIYLIECDNKS